MEPSTKRRGEISPVFVIVAGLAIAIAVFAGWFLNRPAPHASDSGPSAEAKAYLANLRLSNVTLKAAENLMRQQVVYIDGSITNGGSRPIKRIDVYCIFTSAEGQEVYRERVAVVRASAAAPFSSHQTRSFELTFDSLPDNWNQGIPRLVIAQIEFAA